MGSVLESAGIDPGILLLILLLLVTVLLIVVANLSLAIKRLDGKYKTFMKGKDAQSLEKVFTKKILEIDRMVEINNNHAAVIRDIYKMTESTLSKYGILKYDAFDDVGGKLSFALAMVDRNNTGFILNAIHSRENCFLYIKEIVNGESYILLSDEEVEALSRAVNFGIEIDEQSL